MLWHDCAEPVSLPTAVHHNRGKYRRHLNADYTVDIDNGASTDNRSPVGCRMGAQSPQFVRRRRLRWFVIYCVVYVFARSYWFFVFFSDRFSFCRLVRVGSVRFVTTCFCYWIRFSPYLCLKIERFFKLRSSQRIRQPNGFFLFGLSHERVST